MVSKGENYLQWHLCWLFSLISLCFHMETKDGDKQVYWKCFSSLEVLPCLKGIWEVLTFIQHFQTLWRLVRIILGKLMDMHLPSGRQYVHGAGTTLRKIFCVEPHNFQIRNALGAYQCLQSGIKRKGPEEWVVPWGPARCTSRMTVTSSLR